MGSVLHITSGDIAGGILAKAGLPGEVFVIHDILYDEDRHPGWPDMDALTTRALFLEKTTAGGLDRESGDIIRDNGRGSQKTAAMGDPGIHREHRIQQPDWWRDE